MFAFEWNLKTDGVIRSEECRNILGLGSDATRDTGEGFFGKIHPEDRAAFIEVLHRLNPEDDRYTATYRVIRPADGQIITLEESARGFFDSDGKLQRLYGMTMDITERQRAEEALRQSEEGFRQLFENAVDILILHDKGRIVAVNQQACRILGYTREELLRMSAFDIEVGIGKEDLINLWQRGGESITLAGVFRRRDGSTFPVEIRGGEIRHRGQNLRLAAVRDVTERKLAEVALRQSQKRYRMLAGHLLTAQEAERKRLARELHDDLSQRLAALAMEAETLDHQKSHQTGPNRAGMKEMKDKLVELSIDVHAMSRRLHPSILDDLGLADAVASECATFRKRNGIVVNYRTENISREVPPDVAVCLYRIVQEALRNISRHAGATEVAISLVGENQAIHLSIRDNGKGFDPGQKTSQVGLGLDSMKERAYLIGADFSIESQPGDGTMIDVLAPLSRRGV
jgi:PAS domain S-box-containing protein